MRQIGMSNGKPMGIAENSPRMRYSAAYPTRVERMLRREEKATVVAISCGN